MGKLKTKPKKLAEVLADQPEPFDIARLAAQLYAGDRAAGRAMKTLEDYANEARIVLTEAAHYAKRKS